MMKRRGIVRVSGEVLKQALKLDTEDDVIDVTFNRVTGIAELLISGPQVPECPEGAMPLCVSQRMLADES